MLNIKTLSCYLIMVISHLNLIRVGHAFFVNFSHSREWEDFISVGIGICHAVDSVLTMQKTNFYEVSDESDEGLNVDEFHVSTGIEDVAMWCFIIS